MKRAKILIIILVSILILTFINFNQSKGEFRTNHKKNSPWKSFPGTFRLTPAFPDKCSRYDILTFKPSEGDFDLVKICGEFPYARYFSFNMYDSSKAIDLDAVLDGDIIPNEGSINPYKIGVDRNHKNREYTIWLIKEGITKPFEIDNFMIIPSDVEILNIILRVYRPDEKATNSGNVELPEISFLNEDMKAGIPPDFGVEFNYLISRLSSFVFRSEFIETWDISKHFVGDNIIFFRISDEGFFPNAHNEYISAPLTKFYQNKIAMVNFKPPTYEDTYKGDRFEGGKEVRYWSINVGGIGITGTSDGLCDDQIKTNSNGTVTICVAPGFMKNTIEKMGFNYLKWGFTYKPLMIYRQMLADNNFEGAISNVPIINWPIKPENITQDFFNQNAAINYMGEYCPTGSIYSIGEFLIDFKMN